MATKAYLTADEHAAIAEHLESEPIKALGVEYKKDAEGRYVLVVQPRDGYALENVTALKGSAAKIRDERDALQDRVKEFGDVDPETIQTLADKAKRFDELDPKAEAGKVMAKLDEWKADFKEKTESAHAAELKAVTDRLAATETQLSDNLIEVQARAIMADPEIDANAVLLMPHVRNRTTTVIGDDGKMRVIVVNPAKPGSAMIGKDGEDMGLKELIADELRSVDALKPAFGAPAASGSGQRSDSSTQSRSGRKQSDYTPKDRSLYIREHGREAWMKLPK